MSKTLTIAVTITSLISISSAEILSCNAQTQPGRVCGPCSQAGLCNLQCMNLEDICVESRLYCKQGEKCQIDCLANYACMEGIIDAQTATDLQLTCGMATSCETTTVNAGMKTNIDISCGGIENTCKNLMLNAHYGGNITINCDSYESCVGLTISASSAENVALNCNDNTGAVCNGVRLFCGTGDCSIQCSGFNKCPSVQVVTGAARSWTCIGTAAECQSVPANYAPPTGAPTKFPTTAPTAVTGLPTGAPSKQPSGRPTSIPSKSPTTRPSSQPTGRPTAAPTTDRPTKNPSASPTKRPSSNPTTSPTTKPTQKPSSDPTRSPTKPTVEPSYAPTRKGETREPTKSPSKSPTMRPTPRPTNKPTAKPTNNPITPTEPDTTSSATADVNPGNNPTDEEDLAPSLAPIASTSEPTTTGKPTTLPPTSDQTDGEICCECIEPTLGIKKCAKDPQCTEKICQVDPYCCENQWDNTCAYYASDQCTKSQQTPSTTALTAPNQNDQLDLFWQLALVVFAIMVLIVSCCIILLRIHRMCQNCKHRKLQKEKSLSARKVKRRTNSQKHRGVGGITGVLGIPPVNTPANSVYTASIKSGTSSYYHSKNKINEESHTMTHAEDEIDDGLHHGHPMDTYSSHYGSVHSGHPVDRNSSVPVKRLSSKSYIKRYYNIKSVGTMDERSNASSGGNYSANGHRFMRQQYGKNNIDPHDPNAQHMLGHHANFMENAVDLEFGDDHHKEDRFMINNIVNAEDDDEDSLSMTDDTNYVIGHAENTFKAGKVKRAKSVKNNNNKLDPFKKQNTIQTESHKSTETSMERDETESDIDDEDDDVLSANLISHPGHNHNIKPSDDIDDMIDINIKEVMHKHEVDDGRPSFTQQKRRSGRGAKALVDRTDRNHNNNNYGLNDDDRGMNDDHRNNDRLGDHIDNDDDDITVTDEHIDDMMSNLRKIQSVKHHSI